MNDNLILVVDDDPMNRAIAEESLDGEYPVVTAENGLEAIEAVKEHVPSLVLLDIMMPEMDGYTACRAIKESPFGETTQVILVSARASTEERLQGYDAGADDYLTKPFEQDELLAKVRVQLRLRDSLFQLARTKTQVAVENNSLEAHVAEQEKELTDTRDLVVFALARLAESRDPETGHHLSRIRNYCKALAEQLQKQGPYADQIDARFTEEIFRASPLHDIGKVGVPDAILLKPGRLTEDEFDVMKTHCDIGAEALREVAAQHEGCSFLDMAIEIAQSHHEKYDGTGYPQHLTGRSIPLAARITAVADVFDALTTKRVYKDAFSVERARDIIRSDTGSHFDPAVVAAFEACFDEFVAIRDRLEDADPTPIDGETGDTGEATQDQAA
ncbi:MAG: HD domain-containing phosphohydrolase [Planctomycetota bacterium]